MHGRLLITSLILLVISLAVMPSFVYAQNFDPYIWETYKINSLNTQITDPLIQELRKEVDKITSKGALAPLRLNFSDLDSDGYWYYLERGRIITTLAYAYPYLTSTEQSQVKTYVQTNLSSGTEAPWTTKTKGNGEGQERNYHGYVETSGRFAGYSRSASTAPVLHIIYGLWLYGYRTGDWATIQNYWNNIKTFYSNNKGSYILYGQMSGFIGMARLARQFNDTATQSTAITDASSNLSAGLNQNTIETRQKQTIYNYFYCDRCGGYFPGQPWMFLESSPEIFRYLNDNVKTDSLNRINQFTTQYPYWWVAQQPSFTRWTGDEGQGITSEPFGMIYPFERWIKKTPAATLKNYMRSMPTSIGDLFWIEALVQTIEAYGQTCWVDIRTNTQTSCEGTVPTQPAVSPSVTPSQKLGDANGDNQVNGADYIIWLNNYGSATTSGASKGDFNQDGNVNGADYITWLNHYGS